MSPPDPRGRPPRTGVDPEAGTDPGEPVPVLGRTRELDEVQQGSGWERSAHAPAAPRRPPPHAPEDLEPELEPVRAGVSSAGVLALSSSLCLLLAAVLVVLPEARAAWTGSSAEFVPGGPVVVPDGEVTAEVREPFKDFVVMVDSEPPGAEVKVNGEDQGEAPVSVGVGCSIGASVTIEFRMKGYETATHTTRCTDDGLVRVMAKLRKRGPRHP